jgi:hypothetical protein
MGAILGSVEGFEAHAVRTSTSSLARTYDGVVTDLADRYGSTSSRQRRTVLVLSGVAALVVLVLVVWSFVDHADPEVRSQLTRYDVVSPHEATADLTVVRQSEEVAATCLVQALASDHSVVGESTQEVASGATEQVLRVTVRTEREAVSVVSEGCTTPDQPRPR